MLARHTARLALIAVLLTLARPAGWCPPCAAQTGTVHQATGNGVAFTADARWVDGNGYRPVQISVVPLTPPVADRTLQVEFLVSRNWRDQYDLRVVQDIEIPASSGPVEATMAVPQYVYWNAYRINVSEDGRLRKRLSTNGWVRVGNRTNDLADCLPAVVVVGAELPDTNALAASLSTHILLYDQYSSDSVPANRLPNLATRTAAQLPQRWIDYSNVDILCMSLDELAALQRPDPQKFRAVCQWVAAGGNLWVYDIGDDWQRIGRLEGLLGLPPGAGDDTRDPLARGWQEPNARQYGKPVRGAISSNVPIIEDNVTERPAARPRSLPGRPEFLLRQYDAGLIVALAAGDPFPGQPDQWAWLLNSMGSHRWLWYQRHGVSMRGTNPDYWKFLIPDVGLAPVVEFCVLITLFVLAIGPLNYWLLRRWGRIHLLVVTIPGSAALVTFLLFAYALVSDGLGTRVRVRSVTYLDQRRGQAACWSRLSYYAGLAPSRGMEFPADVVVLPLQFIPPAAANFIPGGSGLAPEPRDLIWREDQRLVSGWLRSRTPTQYLAVRSRASRVGLDVVAAAGGEKLQVTNGLTTPIRQLLVRSLEGDYYWVSDLAADDTAGAAPIEAGEGLQRLAKTYSENRPRLPPRLDQQNYGGMFGMPNRMYYAFSSSGRQVAPATQQTGRLERSLAQITGGSAADPTPLAPGCYCAVVEQSPEVVLGIRGAREEESYHVIFGRW